MITNKYYQYTDAELNLDPKTKFIRKPVSELFSSGPFKPAKYEHLLKVRSKGSACYILNLKTTYLFHRKKATYLVEMPTLFFLGDALAFNITNIKVEIPGLVITHIRVQLCIPVKAYNLVEEIDCDTLIQDLEGGVGPGNDPYVQILPLVKKSK